ncbi:MAG TPA: hypothetical protein VGP99_08350 [Tepidisphaeraceae bacterium]|jgi:hypothetical protein|nr:hypothetical protein [Tepidisphaeraceae bacterium]
MPTEEQLREKALMDARMNIKSIIKGPAAPEFVSAEARWHEHELRQIYEQEMAIWYQYGKFDVFVDADNEPVGFMDYAKAANCEYKELPRKRVLELCMQTGMLPKGAAISSLKKGPDNCIETIIASKPEKVDCPRYLVRINPLLEKVFCFVPVGVNP